MGKSVCFTTFIFGEKYQDYLPFVLYSLKKSYPKYTPILFVHEQLRDDLKNKIELINCLGNFVIKEKKFSDIKIQNVFQGKALRWVLRDEIIKDYDYVYFIDIDILYFREPIPLHEQHIKHMKLLDLPFSNIMRMQIYENRRLNTFIKRLRRHGIKNAVKKFLEGTTIEQRLSGLHFVETKKYFPRVKSAQRKYENILNDYKYLKYFQGIDDEPILYRICKESGFNLENLYFSAFDSSSHQYSVNFNDFNKRNFRPHHGIHLAPFRKNISKQDKRIKNILNSDVYNYYLNKLNEYLSDDLFTTLLRSSDDFIREQFESMFQYYSIENPIKN